ncbi:hypothetical protein [Phreatobacter sp.]|uniref:hypothetical protein n=1 Tax=Phreatobacter sp. TaxID=1966341 RepID=UPI003F71126D
MMRGGMAMLAGLGVVLGGGVGAAAQPGGQPAYVGRWADQQGWCRNRVGTDELPLTIRQRSLDGVEWACRFVQVTGSPPEWRVTARCEGEGMTNRKRFIFRVEGNRMRMTYVDRGNRTFSAVRCP